MKTGKKGQRNNRNKWATTNRLTEGTEKDKQHTKLLADFSSSFKTQFPFPNKPTTSTYKGVNQRSKHVTQVQHNTSTTAKT